ncbi:MAG TPA: lasso peptide biosynthesis B2 protein [Sphingomicrobium sp.]|jgi:hypothetical protein|nr:lasso peptide biosynthesis B2 protein [Sphingomicrobium sp.]
MDNAAATSFGLVDGTPVFMDAAGDSYFRLEHEEECAFLAALKKEEGRGGSFVHGLVRGPAPGEWEIEPLPLPTPPKRALPGPRGPGNPNILQMAAVAKLLLLVGRALERQSIGDILENVVPVNSNKPGAARDPIARAIAFRNARRLLPLRGNCLSDSLALMRWLAAAGDRAILVFGVKLDPFAAHCWVQSGEIALNDHPERIERFTPVRIIGCTSATP